MLKKKKAALLDGKSSKSSRQTRLSDAAESERAAARVKDVIASFRKTASRRRDRVNLKRSQSASRVQGIHGISPAMKKSLWQKSHRRRRQQVVLRPSMDFLLNDLKAKVASKKSKDANSSSNNNNKGNTTADAVTRAEQLFLLSTHPVAPAKELPNTPPLKSSEHWAEPGWHLDLEVPEVKRRPSTILPTCPVFPVFEKYQLEFSTIPGRQAGSLVQTKHLRALATPLSTVAQAISLAEEKLVVGNKVKCDGDPLNISESAMMTGYTFAMKSSSKSGSQPRRKSASTPKDEGEAATSTKKPHSAVDDASTKTAKMLNATSSARPGSQQAMRWTSKTEKPTQRRRTSKTDVSPRVNRKTDLTPTTGMPMAPQPPNFIQQQTPMGVRAMYAQASNSQPIDPQAAQYGQSFMKTGSLAQPPQGQHAGLQQLQPQQLQALPQQQLLPQPHQQFTNSRQQFQHHQMTQMRMLQQQQQSGGYQQAGQQHQQMQFFPTVPQATRQQSYGGQQGPLTMPGSRGVTPVMPHPSQRRSAQGDNEQNDPLYMLKDM